MPISGSFNSGPAPVMLQDHGNPVRFRNIYALPVKPSADGDGPTTRPAEGRSGEGRSGEGRPAEGRRGN